MDGRAQGQLHRGVERAVGAVSDCQARDAADGDVIDHDGGILRKSRYVNKFDRDGERSCAVA